MNRSTPIPDPFSARASCGAATRDYTYYRLDRRAARADLARMPMTVKVLLENIAAQRRPRRRPRGRSAATLALVAAHAPRSRRRSPFMPARVLLQDFTGVPAVVDLAAMRDAMADIGGDPARIEPLVPADLVIDHSVQVDRFRRRTRSPSTSTASTSATASATSCCAGRRPPSPACASCRPARASSTRSTSSTSPRSSSPATTIDGETVAFPDTLVGHRLAHHDGQRPRRARLRRRRHRGRGGPAWPAAVPANAARRRRAPVRRPAARLDGDRPRAGRQPTCCARMASWARSSSSPATAWPRWRWPTARRSRTCRPSTARRPRSSRSTTRRSPTCARRVEPKTQVALVEATPRRTRCGASLVQVPTSTKRSSSTFRPIEPTVAGPRRPQDKVRLPDLPANFREAYPRTDFDRAAVVVRVGGESADARPRLGGHRRDHLVHQHEQPDGDDRRRAACAKRARARAVGQADGQDVTGARLARRDRIPTRRRACSSRSSSSASASSATAARRASATAGRSTTEVAKAIEANELVVAAVLSGNRNFEGRIHPLARACYLASPPLVVAFALAGTVEIDLLNEPLGTDSDGKPVFLADIWPTPEEVRDTIAKAVSPDIFERIYASVFDGDERWRACPCRSAAAATTGTRPQPTSRGRRSSTACAREPAAGAGHRGARVARACSATPSRPITSPRPDRSRPGARPASGCRSTAWRRSSSTATARGAAITR